MALSKEQIFAAADLKTETVQVPEWGGEVIVSTLTGMDKDAFEVSMVEGRGSNQKANLANLRARLVALTVVDEQGARIFDDGDDVERLGKKSAKALDRVYAVAARLNGMGKAEVEELTKNSESAPSDGSTSSSPGN